MGGCAHRQWLMSADPPGSQCSGVKPGWRPAHPHKDGRELQASCFSKGTLASKPCSNASSEARSENLWLFPGTIACWCGWQQRSSSPAWPLQPVPHCSWWSFVPHVTSNAVGMSIIVPYPGGQREVLQGQVTKQQNKNKQPKRFSWKYRDLLW